VRVVCFCSCVRCVHTRSQRTRDSCASACVIACAAARRHTSEVAPLAPLDGAGRPPGKRYSLDAALPVPHRDSQRLLARHSAPSTPMDVFDGSDEDGQQVQSVLAMYTSSLQVRRPL
jgi:hypothetical protein